MLRLFIAGLILAATASFTTAQEKENENAKPTPAQQKVLDNPEDANALRGYLIGELMKINTLSRTDPDAAERGIKEVEAFLESHKPEGDAAKRMLASGENAISGLKQQVALAKLSLEDIKAKLEKNPDDVESIGNYASKLGMTIGPIARKEPDKAEKLMKEGQEYLTALNEKSEEKATKTAIDRALASIGRYEATIEGAKKLAALVGTDAAKLQVDAWVNGEPLTDEDLKGKVVLLDFWAVWCGPCIATFPHLIEWDKKYDDLEIVGVTNYYQYAWDEEAKRAKRGEDVAEEDEQEMLRQFAKQHSLTHRFALQTDRKLSEHYAVTGIPQAVVIDKTGKVRLIRVGSGEENAKDIQELIEKLIEE